MDNSSLDRPLSAHRFLQPVATAPVGGPPRDGIGLRDVLGILRRRYLVVTAVAIPILAAAAWFIVAQYPQYRATSTIRLANMRQSMTSGIALPDVPTVTERISNPELSQIQLLTSRSLIGSVVDSLGLRLRPDFHDFAARLLSDVQVALSAPTDTLDLAFAATHYTVRGKRHWASARYGEPIQVEGVHFVVLARPRAEAKTWFVLSREAAIDVVLQNLRVMPRPMTDIVDVSYTAFRPRIAQVVANSIVDLYRSRDLETAREQAHRRRVFLEGQLVESDSALTDAQLALSAFRRRAQLYSSRDKLAAQQTDLMSLDTQRAALAANRAMFGSLLAQLHGSTPANLGANLGALMASPELATDPAISTLYRQLAQLRVERDSLTTGAWRNPSTDPAVRRLTDLIAATYSHIEGAIRGHLAGLDARIDALDGLRKVTATVIEGLPSLESEEVRLLQRVASVQTMADQLRAQHQRARVAEAVEIGGVAIVDRAPLPYQTAGLPRWLEVVLGVVLALLLGGAIAIVMDVMNTSMRRQQEVEEVLHLPSLAVIPHAPLGKASSARDRLANLFNGMHGGRLARRTDTVSLANIPAMGAEAYRVLRTNLLFSSNAQGLRTLVVTSALPQEGKTSVAANLAISLACDGMRILLVDCDLRCPRLHQLFGGTRSPGLAQVLANTVPLAEATRATAIPGLSFLPCGSVPKNPSDVVRGPRIRNVLSTLADGYDLAILDTPPVLPVADAVILSALSDGVLMVVRAGKTTRALTQDACARLVAVGANIVGTVLNDPSGRNEKPYSHAHEYTSNGNGNGNGNGTGAAAHA